MRRVLSFSLLFAAALLFLWPREAGAVAANPVDRSKAADDMANNIPGWSIWSPELSPGEQAIRQRVSDLEAEIRDIEEEIGELRREWGLQQFAAGGNLLTPESVALEYKIRDLEKRLGELRKTLQPELDVLNDSIVPELSPLVVLFSPERAAQLSFGEPTLSAAPIATPRAPSGGLSLSVRAHAASFDLGGAVDRGGHVRGVTATASRPLDARTTGALFGAVHGGDIESKRLTSSLDQTQVSAGAALVRRLSERVVATVLAYFGRSQNDINLDGGRGSFDTTTVGVIGRVQSRWSVFPWVVVPHVTVDARRVRREGYTDTAAVVVPGSTRSYGTLSTGARASLPRFYRGQAGRHTPLMLEPYVQADAHWRFAGAQDLTLSNSGPLVLENASAFASIAAGINAVLYSGHRMGAQIAYHGIGSAYEAVSGTLFFSFASGARLGATLGFAGGSGGWDGALAGNGFTSTGWQAGTDVLAPTGRGFFTGAKLTIPLQ